MPAERLERTDQARVRRAESGRVGKGRATGELGEHLALAR